MGGLVCAIPRRAVLRFDEVPNRPTAIKAFDLQMRQLYANPIIATAVGENYALGEQVCEILAKQNWTPPDREKLLEVVDNLYDHETVT